MQYSKGDDILKPSIWIAIYLPMFIMFFIIIPSQQRIVLMNQLRRKRGGVIMSNQLIKDCIGKICKISTGSLGSTYNRVEIIELIDNWIKVEKNGKIDLINTDYIQNIKILSNEK